MIKRNPISLMPPTPNAWYRMALADDTCIGSFIQNQDNVANFYVCPFLPPNLFAAQWFPPGGVQYDDKIPWQDELWVYCDTPGKSITFSRAYETKS